MSIAFSEPFGATLYDYGGGFVHVCNPLFSADGQSKAVDHTYSNAVNGAAMALAKVRVLALGGTILVLPAGEAIVTDSSFNASGLTFWGDGSSLTVNGVVKTVRQFGQIAFQMEAIIWSGVALTGTNVLPPGLRIGYASTLTSVTVRVGTAPTGASLTVVTKVNGSTVATSAVLATTTSITTSGLSVALAAGDIVTWDITTIGSTIAGSDIAVALVGS